jgi:hypothetical protein
MLLIRTLYAICEAHALNGVLFYFCAIFNSAAVPHSGPVVPHLARTAHFVEYMNCHEHHVYHYDTLHPTNAEI